jgi:hypothetical protein
VQRHRVERRVETLAAVRDRGVGEFTDDAGFGRVLPQDGAETSEPQFGWISATGNFPRESRSALSSSRAYSLTARGLGFGSNYSYEVRWGRPGFGFAENGSNCS